MVASMPPPVVTMIDVRRGGWIRRRDRVEPEHAGDTAFDAADDTTDRSADHGADRSCRLTAHIGAVRRAIGDALGLSGGQRKRKSKHGSSRQQIQFHATFLS